MVTLTQHRRCLYCGSRWHTERHCTQRGEPMTDTTDDNTSNDDDFDEREQYDNDVKELRQRVERLEQHHTVVTYPDLDEHDNDNDDEQ